MNHRCEICGRLAPRVCRRCIQLLPIEDQEKPTEVIIASIRAEIAARALSGPINLVEKMKTPKRLVRKFVPGSGFEFVLEDE